MDTRVASGAGRAADPDPAVLAAIGDLELVARVTVDGTVSGLHRSRFHGYSAEFSEYRHYRPGDDLKYVDWKLFARTDRVYTKVYRETTNMVAQVIVDASASMTYGGRSGVTKFDYARILASALAHLVSRQGDAVGLVLYDEDLRRYLPSRAGASHLRRLLIELARSVASGTTSTARALRRSVDLLRRRGVIWLLSDLYDEGGVERELKRALQLGHEAALFHVLTPEEVQFPFAGDQELRDLETGARRLVHATAAHRYRDDMAAFMERWRHRCTALSIDYVRVMTDTSPVRPLRSYLINRRHRSLL